MRTGLIECLLGFLDGRLWLCCWHRSCRKYANMAWRHTRGLRPTCLSVRWVAPVLLKAIAKVPSAPHGPHLAVDEVTSSRHSQAPCPLEFRLSSRPKLCPPQSESRLRGGESPLTRSRCSMSFPPTLSRSSTSARPRPFASWLRNEVLSCAPQWSRNCA